MKTIEQIQKKRRKLHTKLQLLRSKQPEYLSIKSDAYAEVNQVEIMLIRHEIKMLNWVLNDMKAKQ